MTEIILSGIAASDGIAIGPAYRYVIPELQVPKRTPGTPEEEISRFEDARHQAYQELVAIREIILQRTGDEEQAAIFDAHTLMLDDPTLKQKIQEGIEAGQTVEIALQGASQEIADMLAGMEDEYFAARALDIKDVCSRVLRILLDLPEVTLEKLESPAIIVAKDLTPSDTANLDPDQTLGFCTAAGGLTSHTAILARTLGIPAVVGLGKQLFDHVSDGVDLVLDGGKGTLVLEPSQDTIHQYKKLKGEQEQWLEKIRLVADKETYTADGQRIEVAANVGDVESTYEAAKFGAEGIGLLRTEFLYLNELHPPDEEKQVKIYREIFEAMQGKPIIVRTLDIGGDKPPSYLHFEEELNPFLGWRAIRICLDDQPLFKTQLRAILRAAAGHNVLVMFPMITSLEELLAAKEVLFEAQKELGAEGLEYAQEIPVGIMVETPAAVALVDIFAPECDFFSLGTNDLTQYTLAVDRGNERVSKLFQPLHPAVLRLIKQTINQAHANDKWVGMCGELAGMQKAIPILLGLGLDEFSMVSRAIPEAKWLISNLEGSQARGIASEALSLGTSAEVETFMQTILEGLK